MGFRNWWEVRAQKVAEKAAHNDRDYDCIYWWGDRNGSAVGVMNERCRVCRPEKP